MKIWLITAVLLLSGCSHTAHDQWSGQDKAQHFIASALLTGVGSEIALHQGSSSARSANIGFLFSISLGAAKELWDSRVTGSGWSWKDLSWDIAGAATGYTICRLADH